MGFAKWVGGSLGWALGGPIGGLVGFALGNLFDRATVLEQSPETYTQGRTESYRTRSATGAGDFGISLVVLSAAVMKANGVVKKSELDYVKRFLVKQFGEATASNLILTLRDVLKKDIPLQQVCLQIKGYMNLDMRLQLLHYLFGIAHADGEVDANEVALIESISGFLGINTLDFKSIKGMFYKDVNSAYAVLEIDAHATEAEVKKAYRKMALKYHPDKVSQLGEDIQKAANEKFLKVQEAYDLICKQRDIK